MAIKFHLEPGALGRFLRTLATLFVVGGLGYALYWVSRPKPRPVDITMVPTAPVIIEQPSVVTQPKQIELPPLPDLPPLPPTPPPEPAKTEPTAPPMRGPGDVKPVKPLKSGKSIAQPKVVPKKASPAAPKSAPKIPEPQASWSTSLKIAQRTNPPSQAQLNIITGQWLVWPGDNKL